MRRGLGSSCDFARTITFGGVGWGSRKAKDVATAAGSIIASGLITASCEAAASTGNIAAAVPIEENTCDHKVQKDPVRVRHQGSEGVTEGDVEA